MSARVILFRGGAKAANFLDGSGGLSSSASQPLMNSAVPPIEMIDTDADFTQPHHKPHPPHHRPTHSLDSENIDETPHSQKPKKREIKTNKAVLVQKIILKKYLLR